MSFNKKEWHRKRITFQNTRINFAENPRMNICSKCGKKYPDELKEQTLMHHEEYDEKNPLSHTIELCRSCHNVLHRAKEKNKGKIHFPVKTGKQHPNWKGDAAKPQSIYRREWARRKREAKNVSI